MTTEQLLRALSDWAGPDPVRARVRDAVTNLVVAVSEGDYKGVDEAGEPYPWLVDLVIISPRDRALNRSRNQLRALVDAKLAQVKASLLARRWGE